MRSEIPTTVISDRTRTPLTGADVEVLNLDDTPALVYASATATTPLPSNVLTTSNGNVDGWLNDGSYKLVLSHADLDPPSQTVYIERLSGDGTLLARGTTIGKATIGLDVLTLDLSTVWGVDDLGEPYYDDAGVPAPDAAVLGVNAAGELYLTRILGQ